MNLYWRWLYVGWLGIILAAIILQFYLAGYGVFGFNGVNGFSAHFVVGDLIGIAGLIGIGIAFATRQPRRIIGVNVLFAVLMIVQFFLAHTGVQAISALHVVNGVAILGVTGFLTRLAAMHATQNQKQAGPAPSSMPVRP
ncbi:MAG TPA: DUF6220 domain-containing protein [Candidatus Limnocylindrales bacterium]|nr:DUF6220 domain-containing protein [Candidatus Limnocylindrales bacterium]